MQRTFGMSTSQPPTSVKPPEPARRSRRIPHSVFGIGAFVLVLLAGLTLIVLSGQFVRDAGAVLALAVGLPILIAFTTVAARRWRRGRLGRA